MIREFGRFYAEDQRDRKHLISPRRTTSRQSRVWRTDRVLDQGRTSHCVGYSFHGLLGASPIRQRVMSPSGIYTFAQMLDEWEGTDYEGTSVRGGAKACMIAGYLEEYQWAFDVNQVVRHLLDKGPVVLGTNWYQGMMDVPLDGYLRISGMKLGGHAYLAYGADLAKGWVVIRNSWGSSWGKNGNALLSLESLERLLSEQGEACAAVEREVSWNEV